MAHRVKCPICNSCMSPMWILPNRYYYCGFCHVYYGGRDSELVVVPSPYSNTVVNNVIEDPILEEENDRATSIIQASKNNGREVSDASSNGSSTGIA